MRLVVIPALTVPVAAILLIPVQVERWIGDSWCGRRYRVRGRNRGPRELLLPGQPLVRGDIGRVCAHCDLNIIDETDNCSLVCG